MLRSLPFFRLGTVVELSLGRAARVAVGLFSTNLRVSAANYV
jgi:hypothetical protein